MLRVGRLPGQVVVAIDLRQDYGMVLHEARRQG